jgi:hypothetical protein
MNAFASFAPRAMPRQRQMILVEITPAELYTLIRELERRAVDCADAGFDHAADLAFMRISELREMGR